MPEEDSTDWSRHVSDGIRRERQNRSCQRIKRWEKKTIEDQRGERVVDGEVIPFEGRPHGTGCCKPAGACPFDRMTCRCQMKLIHRRLGYATLSESVKRMWRSIRIEGKGLVAVSNSRDTFPVLYKVFCGPPGERLDCQRRIMRS